MGEKVKLTDLLQQKNVTTTGKVKLTDLLEKKNVAPTTQANQSTTIPTTEV
jgi:hypothetical protein